MEKSPLSDEQVEYLASELLDTTNQVIVVAERELERAITQEEHGAVREQIRVVGEMFQCSCCGVWTMTCDESRRERDLCAYCAGEDD